MKTQEQVIEAIKSGQTWPRDSCAMLDARDYSRVCDFFPVEQWGTFGFSPKEGAEIEPPKEWAEDAILKALASDLEFAIGKAEDERGISSSLMFDVINMWLWILDDELSGSIEYSCYGMPLYRAVESKYGERLGVKP